MSQSGINPKKRKENPNSTLENFFSQSPAKKLKLDNQAQTPSTVQKSIPKQVEEEKKESPSKHQDLKTLLKLDLNALKTIDDFDKKFVEIADVLLNQSVIVINKTHKYRFAEIEFYFNDHKNHPDTFCHGDEYQMQTGQWYFHRLNGKSYKSGTYKGMDLSFGQGNKIYGGILIRAIQSLTNKTGSDLIEGPCNTVHKIFELCSPEGKKIQECAEFVALKGFNLEAFEKGSILYISSIHDQENEDIKNLMVEKEIIRCPRVGLSLKRHDEQKERFWMADYRFLTEPGKIKKFNLFTALSLIKNKVPIHRIVEITKMKKDTIEQCQIDYQKIIKEDKSKSIKSFQSMYDKMKNQNWVELYAIHQKVYQ